MRVLVVDQDSTMLEALVRALREHFVIDAVTSKGDCLDLLRVNEFELIVACERLEDGSGLEFLGQVAKRWPATLRVFAAERERLKLLQGRLGPFQLFQTLAYPIDPKKLFATLSMASAAHNADADTSNVENVVMGSDEAEPPTAAPAKAVASAQRAAPPAPRRPGKRPALLTASGQPAARRALPPAPVPLRTPGPARPPSAPTSAQQPTRRPNDEDAAIAAAARSNVDPFGAKPETKSRTAFIVGAGVAVAIGAVSLAIKFFGGSDVLNSAESVAIHARPHYSPEVTALVTAIESEFKQDDFRRAQSDVSRLRELAPDHPRLRFFETLLSRPKTTAAATKAAATKAVSAAPKPTAQTPARAQTKPRPVARTPAPATPLVVEAPPAPTPTPVTAPPSETPAASATPAPSAPAAPAPSAAPAQVQTQPQTQTPPAVSKTFSGRTIEETAPAGRKSGGIPIVSAEPVLPRRVSPDYPDSAVRKGLQGSVDVRFTITVKGTVEDVAVVQADPPDVFDRAAVEAVKRWRYDPKTVDGVATESHAQVRLQFKLDSKK